MKPKRWGVFSCPQYYPAGGMMDFVTAFDTEHEANLYVARSFDSEMMVEDMWDYLTRESYPVPTEEEFAAEKENRRRQHQEDVKDPVKGRTYELMLAMTKAMYFPDKD